ncbi:hypothetical protein A2U01_0101890, partial [Trifolium medium]|nr:hypothetical protein [Trifolium medium]
ANTQRTNGRMKFSSGESWRAMTRVSEPSLPLAEALLSEHIKNRQARHKLAQRTSCL